jgi:hypothetical protein
MTPTVVATTATATTTATAIPAVAAVDSFFFFFSCDGEGGGGGGGWQPVAHAASVSARDLVASMLFATKEHSPVAEEQDQHGT